MLGCVLRGVGAAIKADVPRFIPSDYSIDFTKFPPGENRNLDLRRDFHKRLDKTSISATTIFNGALIRTFFDSGVLIAAARSVSPDQERALQFLEDPNRSFFTSPFVYLKVVPKAIFYGKRQSNRLSMRLPREENFPRRPIKG
jgi:hypothetical protein